MKSARLIAHNVRAHDLMARRYEWFHGEIFNPVEQARIADTVRTAIGRVRSTRSRFSALDVGCGTGNLTRHLLAAGLDVTAADVSTRSLAVLATKVTGASGADRLKTVQLNGTDLGNIRSGSMDIVCAYSLLHHVPDYLALVREMIRVLAPGGVLYLDHEDAASLWHPSEEYKSYRAEARPHWAHPERWKRFLLPENYLYKIIRLKYPRATVEGDIHVWPDDHIRWDDIIDIVRASALSQIDYQEYLLYVRGCDLDVYRKYRSRCADVAALMASKPLEA